MAPPPTDLVDQLRHEIDEEAPLPAIVLPPASGSLSNSAASVVNTVEEEEGDNETDEEASDDDSDKGPTFIRSLGAWSKPLHFTPPPTLPEPATPRFGVTEMLQKKRIGSEIEIKNHPTETQGSPKIYFVHFYYSTTSLDTSSSPFQRRISDLGDLRHRAALSRLPILSMPIDKIFKDDASEEKGERARMASFIGAMAVADLVKSTLGPKGMDKILQSTGRGHSVTVTNDGATILKSLHIDNPAAKVLVDISKVQDDEVGDGTTSVVVLAGELLREAEKLVTSKIHPMTIIAGYRMAAECARDALLKRVIDNKENAEKFRSDLMKIAMTTLCSKILSQDKEHFAEMAVDAVFRLKGSTNLEAIQIIKKPGGSLRDSFLDEGFILDKKIGIGQPKRIENAKILVANTAMDTDKVKIYGARVRVDSMTKVAQIEGAEKEKMKDKVNKILAHGINCFVNRQLIYNFPEELFADAGVLAIEHADFEGIERLGLVTGGEIASTFDNPESVKLGHCKLIEEIMIGEDKLIHFSGVEMGQACSIVLRGASHHVLDEAERSLHDALCVLSQTVNDSRVLLGGGWPEMVMAKEVDELARKTAGKKSHAIEAFSRALVAIPTTIADNAGLDSAELVAQLRAEHHTEGCNAGIDVISGAVGDMEERGIYEAFKVKQAVLLSATEAAEMILRVDEIITCAPRRREDRM
ncbi:hypothetical protein DY000_02000930 [Brassica cretica]|uniref:CCT-beta n=3 Tax=Brassiceae TaxID=981071 RepID=A0ABQ7C159_BRACR|nr:hypothetical protein DY000_02000930 [Brassica cretica]